MVEVNNWQGTRTLFKGQCLSSSWSLLSCCVFSRLVRVGVVTLPGHVLEVFMVCICKGRYVLVCVHFRGAGMCWLANMLVYL